MSEDKTRSQVFARRAAVIGGVKLLLFGALAGRMYQLQVVEAERFKVLSEENRINLRLIEPQRGRILDRYGNPLAENVHNYRVVVVAEQAGDLPETLRRLARFVPLTESDFERVLKEVKRNRSFAAIAVNEALSWNQMAAIEVHAPDLPGVDIQVGQRRRYTQGSTTAHILGYVATPSEAELDGDVLLQMPGFRIGKSGVEKQYEAALRGAAGTSEVEVNAVGRVIQEITERRKEPTAGEDIVVALDGELQRHVQQRLAVEPSGSAVVLDVHTGDVLAMGSVPSFDPTLFTRGITGQEWQALTTDPLRPLSNKALSGQYAPGSTFKMVVALAALKAGVDPQHRVSCPGVFSVGNARFHCWKKGGHGAMNMLDGLKHSCDVFFYDTSLRVGIDAIAAMARRLGLGQATGIDLPGEKPGLIPDSNWKEATFGEKWYPGETPSAGIGQGFITATPLQLAVMTARLASGRAVQPRLLREAMIDDNQVAAATAPALDLPESHLALIREGMNKVTNEEGGTAYRIRIALPGMEMAGKTGTAQVRRITASERAGGVTKNEDLPWERRDHALFVGFAPVAAPQYAVAVVVEHGGGGSKVAGPIARDILIETQRRNPSRIDMARRLIEAGAS